MLREKRFNSFLFLIFLFLTAFYIINTTDIPLKTQTSEESSDMESRQFPLTSAWIVNGTPICTEGNRQLVESICTDGNGGVIIAWEDNRTGNENQGVYAQRLSASGELLWNINGNPICTISANDDLDLEMCSDGNGGAIIVWKDNRTGNIDIYTQRIDSDGSIHTGWTPNGVPVCLNDSYQNNPHLVSDESGGAIVSWRDYRNTNSDVYAQRITSAGNRDWWWGGSQDGRPICDDPDYIRDIETCIDGMGGAFIVWEDLRTGGDNISFYAQRVAGNGDLWPDEVVICNGTYYDEPHHLICYDNDGGCIISWCDNRSGDEDIYAQRVNSTGDIQWDKEGKGVCIKSDDQRINDIYSDDDKGAIIAWKEDIFGDDGNIYAQRINSTGDSQWATNGLGICVKPDEQDNVDIATDGNSGAYIVWNDYTGGISHIYAQYVNSSGSPQWATNGIPICLAAGYQGGNEIVSDEAGGAIIVWRDSRNGLYNPDIYGQKINRSGIALSPNAWITNGTAVCWETNTQLNHVICSDEIGGVFIAWEDNRTGNSNRAVYAQRISSNGEILWTSNGVPICTITNYDDPKPVVCSDGSGGAIISWVDNRNGNQDIYAQRIDADGSIHTGWSLNGIVVCANDSDQRNLDTIAINCDGYGNAIILWSDARNGYPMDIYGQRIEADGNRDWYNYETFDWDGIPICSHAYTKYLDGICTDGQGGVIITWEDYRTGGSNPSVYAQRIYYDGNIPTGWNVNGNPICTITNYNDGPNPKICSDGAGGAIIAWNDNRTSEDYLDIYAQRIDGDGNTLWTDNGTAICTAQFDQSIRDICSDGAGGAIIAWEDERNPLSGEDIYVQKLNSLGIPQWGSNGKPICTLNGEQDKARVSNDGAGGAIIAWDDERDPITICDVYAQHVYSDGTLEWTDNGTAICTAQFDQSIRDICSDGAGGAIIAWEDERNGNTDIYAQKIDIGKLGIAPPSGGNGDGDGGVKSEVFDPTMVVVIGLIVVAGAISLVTSRTYVARKGGIRKDTGKVKDYLKQREEVVEDDIVLSKEKHFCLVHKGPIEGYNFICPTCGAYYCIRCVEAVKELENACWSCGKPLDPSQPIKSLEEEYDITPITEKESKQDPPKGKSDNKKLKPKSR